MLAEAKGTQLQLDKSPIRCGSPKPSSTEGIFGNKYIERVVTTPPFIFAIKSPSLLIFVSEDRYEPPFFSLIPKTYK